MVLKVVKMVALATVLPRNLVFWWPQPLCKRFHSTTASQVIAVVEGDEPRFTGPTDPRRGPPAAWAFNLTSSRP